MNNDISTVKSNLIINVKATKELALRVSRKYKGTRFTQVSKEFVSACDAHLKIWIENHVSNLPSLGKTIR
jgi:hypothetical protein